eukprot:9075722-Pyramimonas_sp.AAC.1
MVPILPERNRRVTGFSSCHDDPAKTLVLPGEQDLRGPWERASGREGFSVSAPCAYHDGLDGRAKSQSRTQAFPFVQQLSGSLLACGRR